MEVKDVRVFCVGSDVGALEEDASERVELRFCEIAFRDFKEIQECVVRVVENVRVLRVVGEREAVQSLEFLIIQSFCEFSTSARFLFFFCGRHALDCHVVLLLLLLIRKNVLLRRHRGVVVVVEIMSRMLVRMNRSLVVRECRHRCRVMHVDFVREKHIVVVLLIEIFRVFRADLVNFFRKQDGVSNREQQLVVENPPVLETIFVRFPREVHVHAPVVLPELRLEILEFRIVCL